MAAEVEIRMVDPGAVVALAGARDYYQLPLALHEGGYLRSLVTDLYFPLDNPLFARLARHPRLQGAASKRFREGLDSQNVVVDIQALGFELLSRRWPRYGRLKDAAIGRRARTLALQRGSSLFCCSYYAASAFWPPDAPPHRFLFQVHPHPRVVRRILNEEIERTPVARSSLMGEYELSLAEEDFERLCDEPALANGWVAASSFTARSLAEDGIPLEKVHVVPYGVDRGSFPARPAPPGRGGPFTIIFVGSMSQRKGLADLLEAVRAIDGPGVRLVLCGRGHIDHDLIASYRIKNLELNVNISQQSLIQKLHASDVFVFPTLAEGFAHVVLEAMSCGLPVISTANCCAADIMTDGIEGFIVPIRSPSTISERLTWGMENRQDLEAMGKAASDKAATLTWDRFREGIRGAYRSMMGATSCGRNA